MIESDQIYLPTSACYCLREGVMEGSEQRENMKYLFFIDRQT